MTIKKRIVITTTAFALLFGAMPHRASAQGCIASPNNPSSLYEHDFIHRHTMHAGGLGDMRILTDLWLLAPHKHMDGNIALGLGVKVPTGDDKAADISYRTTGPVTRPVDPSIQPGDGGW